MIPLMRLFALFLALLPSAETAYCGSSAIPYTFEALPDGTFVLGCARPACFGYDPNSGNWATQDSIFNQVGGRPDGYLRTTDSLQRQPFFSPNPQTSTCFSSASCLPGQWAAGYDANSASSPLICCAYPLLSNAQDLGTATVQPGQIAVGGENQGYFDYIRNIQAVRSTSGSIERYDVEMGRMACVEPTPLQTIVETAAVQQQQVAPQSYYQTPYNYYGGWQDFRCFTGDSMIMLADGFMKRMDELSIGEWIKAPASTLSDVVNMPVDSWLHRLPEKETEFIVLKTAAGKVIKLTEDHFLYRTPCNTTENRREMVRAGDVQLGDCLLEAELQTNTFFPTEVTEIGTRVQKGIYAPLTDGGRIIVNGLMASCFSDVGNDVVVQSVREKLVNCDSARGLESLQCNLRETGISLLVEMTKLALPEGITL